MNTEIKTRIEMINKGEVPEGYKETKVGIIPEDWEVKRLEEVCKMYSGGTPKTSNKNYYNGNIPWITSGDLNQRKIKSVSGKISKSGLRNSSAKMIKKGDLLLALYGATAGVSAISEIDAAINQAVLAILPANECNKYLYYFLSLKKDFIISKYTQGGQPNLSASIIKALRISFPSLTEQKKIAQILSTWDKAIELKEKLIEEKKEQKKALMQKLLTGEVRLPGFDGEWEEVRLGEVSDIKTGDKNNEDKVENGKYPFFVRSEKIERIDSYSYDGEAILIPGDGRVGVIYHYINGKFDYHQRVYKISNFTDETNGKYVYYYLKQFFKRQAMKYTAKATVDSLRMSMLTEMLIFIPKSLQEQKSIAQILTTSDKEIDLLTQELEQLKLQKKGLMQLLLTGIIRVNTDN